MLSGDQLDSWLTAINLRYASEGLPHSVRPFHALSEYTAENKCTLSSDHPIAQAIFQWFYAQSPPRAHHIGSMFQGVFYFDAAFWPISIPIVLGKASVNALDCLTTMPAPIKARLSSSAEEAGVYASHWMNCMDYAYGFNEMTQGDGLQPATLNLLSAADGDLRGAMSQLLELRPNRKAILNLRMAVEIFLKSVLVERIPLCDKELRRINHSLSSAANECFKATSSAAFSLIESNVALFPSVNARYDAPRWPNGAIWEATMLTQYTAATVTRVLGGQDLRKNCSGWIGTQLA